MIITQFPFLSFKHIGNPAVAQQELEENDVCKCFGIVSGNKSTACTLISKWFNRINFLHYIHLFAYFHQILQWHEE